MQGFCDNSFCYNGALMIIYKKNVLADFRVVRKTDVKRFELKVQR